MLPATTAFGLACQALIFLIVGAVLGWPVIALGCLAGIVAAGVTVGVVIFRRIADDTRNLLPER